RWSGFHLSASHRLRLGRDSIRPVATAADRHEFAAALLRIWHTPRFYSCPLAVGRGRAFSESSPARPSMRNRRFWAPEFEQLLNQLFTTLGLFGDNLHMMIAGICRVHICK